MCIIIIAHFVTSNREIIAERNTDLSLVAILCFNIILPDSLRIKPPVKTREGYRIAERAGRAFPSARIRQSYWEKMRLGKASREISSKL